MKYFAFILFGALALTFTSCEKEGTAGPAGPSGSAGPAGPAGPAGDNANFAIGEYEVAASEFQGGYAEFAVAEITEDVMESGVVMVYVLDGFGYWNHVPSQWTPIIGFSYVWVEDNGGFLGLDHDNTTPADYTIRVVTMFQRAYEELPSEDITLDYNRLMEFLNK